MGHCIIIFKMIIIFKSPEGLAENCKEERE
jgi:hypothetical protein